MGKTAVFVLTTLHALEPKEGELSILVLCHTRELAIQIGNEYSRFAMHLPGINISVLYGGVPITENKEEIKKKPPHIVVGCPGRIRALVNDGSLKLDNIKHFIIDECDKVLGAVDMRSDVQDIFRRTPHDKQVMMFSATMDKTMREICKKFMQNV